MHNPQAAPAFFADFLNRWKARWAFNFTSGERRQDICISSPDFRQVPVKSAGNGLGYRVVLTTVRNRSSRGYFERCTAKGSRIGAAHHTSRIGAGRPLGPGSVSISKT